MQYRVVLADSARADAGNFYRWVTERAPLHGLEWFEKLLDCLCSLDHSPNRCPLAREAQRSHRKIRNLLSGRRGNVYRILFEIDEERKNGLRSAYSPGRAGAIAT
jgi:mRNA-degrading endonuclease RelE of RelBE toxin-antitoxin system